MVTLFVVLGDYHGLYGNENVVTGIYLSNQSALDAYFSDYDHKSYSIEIWEYNYISSKYCFSYSYSPLHKEHLAPKKLKEKT